MTEQAGLSATINRAVARAREHAAEQFPDGAETTLQVVEWEDTDFKVHVHHGIDNGHASIKEAMQIDYRAEEGMFGFCHIEKRIVWHQDHVIEETVLEAWPHANGTDP
jgi:hypothetical protein